MNATKAEAGRKGGENSWTPEVKAKREADRHTAKQQEAIDTAALRFHLITDAEHSAAVTIDGSESIDDLDQCHLYLHGGGLIPREHTYRLKFGNKV